MADNIPQESMPSQINVFNPEGNLVSIPGHQIQEALNSGYRQATPQDVHDYQNEQQYGSTEQQIKSFAEGALRGTTFGLGTGIETGLGLAKPKDIRGRQETNPVASTTGEIAGLAGSSFIPGAGEANLLSKAGAAGSEALGLEGAGALSKIGSLATKGAIENAMVQGGDEISKMFAQDPNQSAETAMINIGLSGLMGAGIGGAFGTVNPLWQATVGKKMGGFLEAVQRRANGEAIGLPGDISRAVESTGIELSPEIRSVLSGDPEIQNQWHKLMESSTTPGIEMQEAVHDFKKSATSSLLKALGHTEDTLPLPSEISSHEFGTKIINKIADDVGARFKPLSEGFNSIREQFDKIPLKQEDDVLADRLAKMSNDNKWSMFEDSAEHKMYNTVMKGIPNIKTLEDLRLAQSKIWGMAGENGLWNQAGKMVGELRNLETSALERAAGAKGSDTLMKLQLARTGYKAESEMLDNLASNLKIKNYKGPESFVDSLREKNPENIMKALNPKDNAGLIDFLQKEHPEISKMVKDYQLNKVLANATLRAKKGETINAAKLFNSFDSLSPEMKDFLLQKQTQDKISAVRSLMDSLPDHRSSFTAKNLDSIWSKIPGGATAIASMLTGHNPIAGFLLGQASKWVSRDAPDAIRLGFLKFLGHSGPVEPSGFKSMVDFAVANIKGETALNKGVKNIFKAGSEVLPQSKLPNEQDHKKLDKKLSSLSADNTSLVNTGGKTSYYLPDHNQGLSSVSARALQYFNGLRPNSDKLGVLDPERTPSQHEKSQYYRALSVAEQPLVVLKHVKDGTVIPQDIVALQNIYPNLYQRMAHKVFSELTEEVSKGSHVPYNTRIGLSMFLAQPLDSTMTPQFLQASQMANQIGNINKTQGPVVPRGTKQALTKMPGLYQTVSEARSLSRTKEG